MPNKKECVFNNNWLLDSKYSIWLHKSSVKGKVCCSICNKDFDITNMSVAALNSCAAGKKHVDNVASRASIRSTFFVCKNQNVSSDAKPCSSKDTSSTIRAMVIPASATHAEILQTLKVVINHYSLRSCLGLNESFRLMFNDGEVAKSFSLSKTKCMYYINYGLAPYF